MYLMNNLHIIFQVILSKPICLYPDLLLTLPNLRCHKILSVWIVFMETLSSDLLKSISD
jgi:hypothetical protein